MCEVDLIDLIDLIDMLDLIELVELRVRTVEIYGPKICICRGPTLLYIIHEKHCNCTVSAYEYGKRKTLIRKTVRTLGSPF